MNKTIIIIGVVQLLFGILLYIAKRPRHLSHWFLIIWLALIAIFIGSGLLPFEVVDYFKPGILPIIFLFGPVLYLYISSLTIENFRLKPVLLLHLFPFVLICIHRSIVGSASISSSSDLSENPLYIYNKFYYSLFIILQFIYWFMSVKLVVKHKRNIPYYFSNFTSRNTLNWSIVILSLFLIFFIVHLSMFYIYKVLNLGIPKISLLPASLTVLTFVIISFGINQTVIYPDRIKSQKEIPIEIASDQIITKTAIFLTKIRLKSFQKLFSGILKKKNHILILNTVCR